MLVGQRAIWHTKRTVYHSRIKCPIQMLAEPFLSFSQLAHLRAQIVCWEAQGVRIISWHPVCRSIQSM